MMITTIVATESGESRFLDVDVGLTDRGAFGEMSELVQSPGIVFRQVSGTYDSGWHAVPRALHLVVLSGRLQIETSDGVKRIFGPGSVIRAEDQVGKGHRTLALDGVPVQSLLL